jgi:hypothetical protein
MTKRIYVLAVMVGLGGCGDGATGDDEAWGQFVTQYAELYCDLREDCNPSLFESEFGGDEEQCKKAVVINENKARQKKLERDCEFDSDQASKCLGDTQQMSCTDWDNGTLEEVCNPVWQCD